jgi:hypothetical protein
LRIYSEPKCGYRGLQLEEPLVAEGRGQSVSFRLEALPIWVFARC